MARHASLKNAEFIAGPVRVTEGKYGFRILGTERKRQRERTAPTLDAAKEVAMSEASRLMSENPDVLSRRSAVFATLVSRASDPETHTWSPEWANRVERIARLHVIPALGSLDCDRMTRDHIQRFLNGLAAEEYSRSFITHVRNLIAASVREGVRHGIWDFGRDPMDGVTLPRVEEGSSGRPDLDLIPSNDQVLRLIEVLTADWAVLGTMSTVAAFTGVRLGELNALSAADFDFEAARIRVRLSCVESDAGDFRFKVPGKRNSAVRQVVLGGMIVADAVRAHIAGLGEVPRGPNLVAGARVPQQCLFFTREGNPFRRSHLRIVFDRATAEVPGWSEGATWHYLRHYAATRWIRCQVDIATVSKMLGHRQVSTTLDWYVGVDEDSLDHAAATLA